jgi:translation initiation factor RLI1
MSMTAGQLAIQAGREILRKIFSGPDPSISEAEIVNVVRQNVIGKATTVIVESGKVSPVDNDMIMLIAHRSIEMLSHIGDLEVTYSMATDGTRSITTRRTANTPIDELIKAVGETEHGQLSERIRHNSGPDTQEANAVILARIRERVNRPEEEDY